MPLNATALAALAGLGSAATYGAGDFAGGMAAKTNPAIRVVAVVQALEAPLFALLALLAGEPWPSASDALWGIGAGVSLCVGGLGLFRGLAIGPMSLVAPANAVIAAALPVLMQVASGRETLGAPRVLGLALALAGIALVSRGGPEAVSGKGGLVFAAVGGLGFGSAFACLARTSPAATFWPLAVGGAVAATLTSLLVLRGGLGFRTRAPAAILGAAGFAAAGNVLYVLAAHTGAVVTAVVLSSFYPATTVLLAMLLLRERPRAAQWTGLAAVVASVALIA